MIKRILLALPIFIMWSACAESTHLDRLTIDNPTEYNLVVEVKGANDESWLPLGIAHRERETEKRSVVDMGDQWIFRIKYAGEAIGEYRIARSELSGSEWRFHIPEEVGRTLRERGYPSSIG